MGPRNQSRPAGGWGQVRSMRARDRHTGKRAIPTTHKKNKIEKQDLLVEDLGFRTSQFSIYCLRKRVCQGYGCVVVSILDSCGEPRAPGDGNKPAVGTPVDQHIFRNDQATDSRNFYCHEPILCVLRTYASSTSSSMSEERPTFTGAHVHACWGECRPGLSATWFYYSCCGQLAPR